MAVVRRGKKQFGRSAVSGVRFSVAFREKFATERVLRWTTPVLLVVLCLVVFTVRWPEIGHDERRRLESVHGIAPLVLSVARWRRKSKWRMSLFSR
jgi:hypothetical protein